MNACWICTGLRGFTRKCSGRRPELLTPPLATALVGNGPADYELKNPAWLESGAETLDIANASPEYHHNLAVASAMRPGPECFAR